MTPLRPPSQTRCCKICRANATKFGTSDLKRHCPVPGFMLPAAGLDVSYYRCTDCGLIFTDAFDDWSAEDFAAAIYNGSYAAVDPDFLGARPTLMAQIVDREFGSVKSRLRVLDYGAGNGQFAEALRARGWTAVFAYDPFNEKHAEPPTGKFDLITSFETVEHSPTPKETFGEIGSFLSQDALIFFTTLVQPPNVTEIGIDWWYIGPRNGHVTLFSWHALARLLNEQGLKSYSLNDNFHAATSGQPIWAESILKQARLNSI